MLPTKLANKALDILIKIVLLLARHHSHFTTSLSWSKNFVNCLWVFQKIQKSFSLYKTYWEEEKRWLEQYYIDVLHSRVHKQEKVLWQQKLISSSNMSDLSAVLQPSSTQPFTNPRSSGRDILIKSISNKTLFSSSLFLSIYWAEDMLTRLTTRNAMRKGKSLKCWS